MATLTIVYWRDIPAQVIVGKGRRGSKAPLPERFEQAIDRCAMKVGAKDEDAYMASWRKAAPYNVDGEPDEVAKAEALMQNTTRIRSRRWLQMMAMTAEGGLGHGLRNRLMALLNFKKPAPTAPTVTPEMEAFLDGYSIEVMPRTASKVENFRDLLPEGTRVYIAHIEGTPIDDMVDTAARLARDGYNVMPHFPARIIQDEATLSDWIARYQGEANVKQALLLAGGVAWRSLLARSKALCSCWRRAFLTKRALPGCMSQVTPRATVILIPMAA